MNEGLWVGLGVLGFIVLSAWICWVADSPSGRNESYLSAETPKQKELKTLYDLGHLCGKHDGRHGDYGRPTHIAPDENILSWWNGYHDGLKWREEDKKLNGDFTE